MLYQPVLREKDLRFLNQYIKDSGVECPTRRPREGEEARVIPLSLALDIANDWWHEMADEAFSERERVRRRYQKRKARNQNLHTVYSGKVGGF